MNQPLNEHLFAEDKAGFPNWKFSRLNRRWESETLPWDYMDTIKKYLRDEHYLLDLGTGSGEFLLRLNHPYDKTFATEAWEPNLKLCRERLEPLGICVESVSNEKLTRFDDCSFDMVICRHEPYDIGEVYRVLKPTGMFITQQIGGHNNERLSRILAPDFTPKSLKDDLDIAKKTFIKTGFEMIYGDEFFPGIKFYDLEGAIFFAKMIEWEHFYFSVVDDRQRIDRLREKLDSDGYIESAEHRYIIAARKT